MGIAPHGSYICSLLGQQFKYGVCDPFRIHPVIVIDGVGLTQHREFIRQADPLEAAGETVFQQAFRNGATQAAVDGVFLYRNHVPRVPGSLQDGVHVQGLDGMHVDEARSALIKYLDNVRLKRLGQVRIIHGFGSGALRKMVRDYLDTQKGLTYRAGGEHEGGGGCTVVIFN